MSRDYRRTGSYGGNQERDRERESYLRERFNRDRSNRGVAMSRRRSRSLSPTDIDKRRIRTPRNDRDMIDDTILNEISKLPDPSELWDNNQAQDNVHLVPPISPSFQEQQPNQSYGSDYQVPYSGIYDDFSSSASSSRPALDIPSCTTVALPPLPEPTYLTSEDQMVMVKVTVDSEKRHRKAALSKQKEDHVNKASLLKKELETLREQRNELRGDGQRSPSPDTKRFLKENTKLQLEIQNKLKTINNVVEMLDGIIDKEALEMSDSEEITKRSPLPPLKYNYVYYDPEMHWCRVCNEFPPTAKDYLNHLHSPAHYEKAAQHMEAPWHSLNGVNEGFPNVPSAPTKRTPIRGLQFFVPQTGWYCKLCDQFIGDLHCASAHLKSVVHSRNYTNFVQQNPHWETDWMSDRQRAFERPPAPLTPAPAPLPPAPAPAPAPPAEDKSSCTVQYTTHTVTVSKEEYNAKMEDNKNRKVRRISLSSASDSSEEGTKKKARIKRSKNVDEETLEELISINDRKLLENIKSRMKKSIEERQRSTSRDRERILEMQRKIRESERRGLRPEDRRVGRYDSPTLRDRRANSRDRWNTNRDRRANSRDKRANSRDRRASSRDRRANSRDRHASSRDRRGESRTRRGDSRDHRDRSPTRRESSRDRRESSRDRRKSSRDRRKNSRSPERREDKPDLKKVIVIGKMPFFKSQSEEQKKEAELKAAAAAARVEMERLQKLVPAIALSAALGASAPALGAPAPALGAPALGAPALGAPASAPGPASAILPTAPVVLPTPQLPIPISELPQDPNDFQKALEAMFPTDPQKCAEKVEREMLNQALNQPLQQALNQPLQQPGILGPPPPLLGMSPYGLMQAGLFGFNSKAAMFPSPASLMNPRIPRMPNARQNKPRLNQPYQNVANRRNNHQNAKNRIVKKNIVVSKKKGNGNPSGDNKSKQLDDLALLGIDASDVGV